MGQALLIGILEILRIGWARVCSCYVFCDWSLVGQVLLTGILEIVGVWWASVWLFYAWVIRVGCARFC